MKIKNIKIQRNKLDKAKTRIIARLKGDGSISKSKSNYIIKYEVRDYDLLESFKKDIEKIYGLKMYSGFNPSGKTGKLIPFYAIRSIQIYNDLMRYGPFKSRTWIVPKEVYNSNKAIKKEFIKTFFDDEGTVILGKYPEVRLYSINLKGLYQIKNILKSDFCIESRISKGYGENRQVYGLIVRGDNLLKFNKQINFNCLRKKNKLNKIFRK